MVVALLVPAATAPAQGTGEVLYGADGASGNPVTNFLILDPVTGAVTETVGPIGFGVTGLAEDPFTGTLYGSTGGADPNFAGHLITIDKRTGAGTLVGDLVSGQDYAAADITFTPDGVLYGWLEPEDDDLVTIDKTTGAATIVGDAGVSTFGAGLASSPAGVLFFSGDGADGDLNTVDRNTGVLTPVATLTGDPERSLPGMAFDSQGTLFASELQNGGPRPADLVTISTTTGSITDLGPSANRLDAIEFATPPPPVSRTLSLDSNKNKVKKGKKVTLSGQLDAAEAPQLCESNQAVDLQKSKSKQGNFKSFATTQTDAAGAFSAKAKVKKTLFYEAEVQPSGDCLGDESNAKKVKAKEKK